MIAYKWVIKKGKEYRPIINNGAHSLFTRSNIKLKSYKKGNTIKHYIDLQEVTNIKQHRQHFNIPGFHFWTQPDPLEKERYQRCMKSVKGTNFNCTLKCFIREKDIILKDKNRIVAKKFRILGEEK